MTLPISSTLPEVEPARRRSDPTEVRNLSFTETGSGVGGADGREERRGWMTEAQERRW